MNVNNLNQNVNNADFVAVKVGDGNLSARTTNLTGIQVRSSPKIEFLELFDTLLEQGKSYHIAVKINMKNLSALQFALKIKVDGAEIEDVKSGNLPKFNENNYAVFKEKGLISTAWSNNMGTQEAATILYLTIEAKKTVNLSEILVLNDDFTEGVVYDAKGTPAALKLNFTTSSSELIVLSNYPNPFSSETILPFILPKETFVQIKIYDVAGNIVKTTQQSFAKGYNEITLTLPPSSVNGLLICRFITADKTIERKIIIMR